MISFPERVATDARACADHLVGGGGGAAVAGRLRDLAGLADRQVSDERADVIRENADLLMAMWHDMEFGHPHKDGIRQAATILYNIAHVARGGES